VKLLLENGARPDFEDESGQTPLSRAELARKPAVVKLLNSYLTP
jgi:ankyrin repeat protein